MPAVVDPAQFDVQHCARRVSVVSATCVYYRSYPMIKDAPALVLIVLRVAGPSVVLTAQYSLSESKYCKRQLAQLSSTGEIVSLTEQRDHG